MKQWFFILLFVAAGLNTYAQQRTQKAKASKAVTFETVWGGYKGNNITVLPEIARDIIQKSVVVVDDKKTAYTLVRFSLLYKKFGMAEEETEDGPTGKPIPTYTTTIGDFNSNKLSATFINATIDQLKKNDELLLFDIVFKDAKGNNRFAPQLKIVIN
jgi:hypothetical protein